jgi:nicotinamidase-related amidase
MITALDKNTALIIIDLQKGIVQYPTVHPMSGIIDNSVKLVDAFHKAGLPVAIVNVNPGNAKWMSARKDSKPNAAAAPPKEDWTEIIPEIKAAENDFFITKHTWSAFPDTALQAELQKRNITGIVMCGVSTSIGVEGTARDASVLGYNVSFAEDATTDMVEEAFNNSVKNIYPRIGEVGSTDAIIEALNNL